jgi:hypothetical protein
VLQTLHRCLCTAPSILKSNAAIASFGIENVGGTASEIMNLCKCILIARVSVSALVTDGVT